MLARRMGASKCPKPRRLAEKLRQIRESRGLTLGQMALHLSHCPNPPKSSQISQFESGRRQPHLLCLYAYAKYADVYIDTLVDDDLDLPGF
jgi:transcriptional regulator with XRE-family HTH domain